MKLFIGKFRIEFEKPEKHQSELVKPHYVTALQTLRDVVIMIYAFWKSRSIFRF